MEDTGPSALYCQSYVPFLKIKSTFVPRILEIPLSKDAHIWHTARS